MAKKELQFKTETEEAEWWPKNQDLIAERFEQARASGKLGNGTVARVAGERAKQAGASPTITIRLAEEDLAGESFGRRERVAVPDLFQNAASSGAEFRGASRGTSVVVRCLSAVTTLPPVAYARGSVSALPPVQSGLD